MGSGSAAEPLIGAVFSHYRVLEKVGVGGMGEVYLAEDSRLNRKVALKVLPAALTRDADRVARFVREARAAAGVEHPHIASVYDIGEAEGRTFIAMEYVRGQSLRDAIHLRSLTLPQALELAVQVSDALALVHERGVVHRDLKPENILVAEGGYAKIIDFGLAKLLDGPLQATVADSQEAKTENRMLTAQGHILGTVAYMSPEQARGQDVDARSDIFSFGVVLYEMLSGQDPFKKPSAIETLSAILTENPPPLKLATASTPPELQRILRRSLAKAPAERYQTMRELSAQLRELRAKVARGHALRPASPLRWLAGAALVAVLLASTWWAARKAPSAPPAPREPVSVLVADFENRTDDPAFDGGLEQALGIGLEGASFISAYGRPQARKQAAELDPASAGRLDERLAQLVCRSQGIKAAVAGAISPDAGGYRIDAWVIDPVESKRLAEASARAPSKAEVLAAADRLAAELRGKLGDTAAATSPAMAAETFTTASLGAMKSYARAQELQYHGRYDEAMAAYREAIEQDPDLGRAYSGFAVLLGNRGEREGAARQFELALARIDRMSEREKRRTRGAYYLSVQRDPHKAIEEFRALVRDFPADTAGHANLALAYFYVGDMSKALEEGRRATVLYPDNVPQRNNVALYAMYAGDFEGAVQEARAVLELNPRYEKAFVALALSHAAQGRTAEAAETWKRLAAVGPLGDSLAAIGLADLALFEGRVTDAVARLEGGMKAGDEGKSDGPGETSGGRGALRAALLATALVAEGRRPAALAWADRARAATMQESVLYWASTAYLAGGREAEALEIASALGSRLQPIAQAYGLLIEAEARLKRGSVRDALPLLQQSLKLHDTWLGRFTLGRAYVDAGAFAEGHAELEACLARRGEALAAFLDEVPTTRLLPPVHYYLGRAQEGLKSPAASASYRAYLAIRPPASGDPLAADASRRLAGP
ncbi:MAG TPA: serine/threonine-protein kinase [Vicinamibacteria bacterium]|nr:serine/threonine-protein kinase [Vicinamibacteria bacterium]